MTVLIWLSAALFIALVMFYLWSWMAAAKRGDQLDEDCQFTHEWAERRP